nr:hypothetical protein [Bradyrhizobium sp.]
MPPSRGSLMDVALGLDSSRKPWRDEDGKDIQDINDRR